MSIVWVFALARCGDGGTPPGTERGRCYPNETCNQGLTCLSTYCVRVDVDGGDGWDGGMGMGADGLEAGSADALHGDGSPDRIDPAPHPRLPQIANLGGPVLQAPKVQPILYASDTAAPDLEAFLEELATTTYWRDTTSEYGIGSLVVLPSITIASSAPSVLTDDALQLSLATNTTGSLPSWGAADPGTVYLFVIPAESTVTLSQGTCCRDFGGYHYETTSGAVTIPYAVACSCPGVLGPNVSALQERTVTISHELVEAATDPFPASNPALYGADQADLIWTWFTGGEVGDMCIISPDALIVPTGSRFMVQRSWSNAAAAQGKNPCVPRVVRAPYFNSFPALERVVYGTQAFGYFTQGVHVPIGTSRTIDVDLYSSEPTARPLNVDVYSYEDFFGGSTSNLGLSLDRGSGSNGDKLHLTIVPRVANSSLGGEAFVIISSYGRAGDLGFETNLTMGLVTN